jgi:hypothetical protein
MHVGLNLVYLQRDSGGLGTYARELMRGLKVVDPALRLTAWVSRDIPEDLLAEHRDVNWVRLPDHRSMSRSSCSCSVSTRAGVASTSFTDPRTRRPSSRRVSPRS